MDRVRKESRDKNQEIRIKRKELRSGKILIKILILAVLYLDSHSLAS
ncbi:hypothetical protein SAMN05192573_10288 [Mucilaginibacter gossypii]|uniref:Uncharacterized protein n=1 Tax=Mucilaginibacter gossypii TaxID=551996 RepID=A0A1G7R0S2_9SPHI|nr:hypothetical protein SAMN05192573_10288 [Mucilaginibacter gossypii]